MHIKGDNTPLLAEPALPSTNWLLIGLTLCCLSISLYSMVQAKNMIRNLRGLEDTFSATKSGGGLTKVTIDLPSSHTTRKFGVQTVDEEGQVLIHKSQVLVSPSTRLDGKRQEPMRLTEGGGMYTAGNMWCHPNWEEKENFRRYGLSVMAGMVSNLLAKGTNTMKGKKFHLLKRGDHLWNSLDEVNGMVQTQVSKDLLSRAVLNSKQVKEALKAKEKEIETMKREMDALKSKETKKTEKNNSQLEERIEELTALLEVVTQERDILSEENKCLKRDVRALQRAQDNLMSDLTSMKREYSEQKGQLSIMQQQLTLLMDERKEKQEVNKSDETTDERDLMFMDSTLVDELWDCFCDKENLLACQVFIKGSAIIASD